MVAQTEQARSEEPALWMQQAVLRFAYRSATDDAFPSPASETHDHSQPHIISYHIGT